MSVRILGVLAVSAMALAACGDDTGGAGGSGGGTGGTDPSTTSSTGGEGGNGTTSTTGGGGEGGEGTTTTGGGGEGGGGEAGPCAAVCEGDAGCDLSPPDPGDECGQCVQDEADAQSACAIAGAFDPVCCPEGSDCAAYVACVLAQGETCATDEPEGAARAQECVLASCGNCGSPE